MCTAAVGKKGQGCSAAQQGGRAQVAPQGGTDAGTSTPESKRERRYRRESQKEGTTDVASVPGF